MLSKTDVIKVVELGTGEKVEVCAPYKGNYLVRVLHNDPDEQHFDPFYHVDSKTGEVKEFSILADGDPMEVQAAFEAVK